MKRLRNIKARDITNKLKPSASWMQSALSVMVSTYMVFILGCGIVHLVDLTIEYESFWASLTVLTLFGFFALLAQSMFRFALDTKPRKFISKARTCAQVHFATIFLITYCVIYYLKTSNGAAC